MISFEDAGSCSYSRDYYVMTLSEIKDKVSIGEKEGRKISVRGMKIPFSPVTGVAPFLIEKEIRYSVRQMVVKTITIYE